MSDAGDLDKLRAEIARLTKLANDRSREGRAAVATLDSEREANARLTEENARLREIMLSARNTIANGDPHHARAVLEIALDHARKQQETET